MSTAENIIQKTANINNQGSWYEKNGNIEAAIGLYEQNVRSHVVATHSYDRLMVLYRRTNELEKEKSVIETAIGVFKKENERRAENAIKRYKHLKNEIITALETGEDVRDGHWVVFGQYPVLKYMQRLHKLEKLITNKK